MMFRCDLTSIPPSGSANVGPGFGGHTDNLARWGNGKIGTTGPSKTLDGITSQNVTNTHDEHERNGEMRDREKAKYRKRMKRRKWLVHIFYMISYIVKSRDGEHTSLGIERRSIFELQSAVYTQNH